MKYKGFIVSCLILFALVSVSKAQENKVNVEKDSLIGQLYTEDSYFDPIQDIDNNWVISLEEIEFCTNPKFMWVKDLELIPYEQKPSPPINF